jgi:hypothetical protein
VENTVRDWGCLIPIRSLQVPQTAVHCRGCETSTEQAHYKFLNYYYLQWAPRSSLTTVLLATTGLVLDYWYTGWNMGAVLLASCRVFDFDLTGQTRGQISQKRGQLPARPDPVKSSPTRPPSGSVASWGFFYLIAEDYLIQC